MAYRRKRRNRGTWLQTLGARLDETSDSFFNGFSFSMPVDSTQFYTYIQPVTTDAPSFQGDSVNDQTVMGDVIGNEYFLDRIVGKIHLQTLAGDSLAPVLVGAGFFVAQADDVTKSIPIGSATALEERSNYCPIEADTVREPWIWRRTWILGAQGNTFYEGLAVGDPIGTDTAFGWPNSNSQYGSVLDGPHIDAKTKRRVGQEDRLWFAVATSYIPGFVNPGLMEELQTVIGYVDLRLHGALRRSRPSGRF